MPTLQQKAIRTAMWSMWANAVLAAVKAAVGYFGHSYALIADGIESSTDVFASILVVIGLRYSTQPADKEHPYGHGKVEALTTFAVTGFLFVSACIIVYQSIWHIMTPHELPAPYTLYVLAVIVVIKEAFYRFVKHRSKETRSTSLEADAWHHRSDAITSLLALLGISIALWMGQGYESADDYAALLGAGFIVYNAYLLFRPALGEILDEQLHQDLVQRIRLIAMHVDGVLDTEKCHVRKAGMVFHVDLHLVVDGKISVHDGHFIAHNLKDAIQAELPEVADVLIHVEPNELEQPER